MTGGNLLLAIHHEWERCSSEIFKFSFFLQKIQSCRGAMLIFSVSFQYARQKKRHRCIEQTFGLYGRRQGWDDLREQQQNKCETDRQSRLDAWDKCSGLVHWDDPEEWDGEGSGRGVQDGEHM